MSKKLNVSILVGVLCCFCNSIVAMQENKSRFPYGMRWVKIFNRTGKDFTHINFLIKAGAGEPGEYLRYADLKAGESTLLLRKLDKLQRITLFIHTAALQFAIVGPIVLNQPGAKPNPYLVIKACEKGVRVQMMAPLEFAQYEAPWGPGLKPAATEQC